MIPVECERCGEKVPHRHQLQGHLLDRCKLEECIVCSTIVSGGQCRVTLFLEKNEIT